MAIRTTSELVIGILVNDYGPDYDGNLPSLEPYIATASSIVNKVAVCASAKGETISAEDLELIERWVAAHAYVSMDQVYTSKSTEGASASFQGQTGMYLEGSKYGQMALNLDTSGCLAAITKRQVASGSWLGKAPSEQTDYWQRD